MNPVPNDRLQLRGNGYQRKIRHSCRIQSNELQINHYNTFEDVMENFSVLRKFFMN